MPISFALQVQGAETVKGQLNGVGGALRTVGTSAGQTSKEMQASTTSFKQTALGISTVATSATALYFQFDDLQKVTQRVEKAKVSLTQADVTLQGAQIKLTKLQEKGVTTGAEYERAVLNLQKAQDDYKVKLADVEIAQGDVTQSQIRLALTVVPTVLGSMTALSGAFKGATFSLVGLRAQTTLASMGLGTMSTSARIAQIAMGPLGWAMIGIATVFTLVATNAFGIRDALDSFAKKVEEVFPVLKPVFDFFRNISATLFPDAQEESKELEHQLTGDFTSIADQTQLSAKSQVASMNSIDSAMEKVNVLGSANIRELEGNIKDASRGIISDAERIKDALDSIGVSAPSAADILPMATTPAVEVVEPPTAEEKTKEEQLKASLKDITAQIKEIKNEIDVLGGGLSFTQLETAFKQGSLGGDFKPLFGGLDALEAQRQYIQNQLKQFAPPTFEELLERGKNKQAALKFLKSLGQGSGVLQTSFATDTAPITTYQLGNISPIVTDATNPWMVEVNVTLDGNDIAASIDTKTRTRMMR